MGKEKKYFFMFSEQNTALGHDANSCPFLWFFSLLVICNPIVKWSVD